jgi:Lon-like ATP-dependent protease
MQDLGAKLRMVVMAHRRITLVRKVEETLDPKEHHHHLPTIDDSFMEIPPPIGHHETPSKAETLLSGVLVAETENLVHEPFQTTDEIKALTQEVIKTIRDIIVKLFLSIVFSRNRPIIKP